MCDCMITFTFLNMQTSLVLLRWSQIESAEQLQALLQLNFLMVTSIPNQPTLPV